MKKNVIAVCDTEGEYACNFAEYLNSRKKLPFQAEAFTDVEKLCTYAGKNPPEILLIAEGDVDAQIEKLGAESMILLSENKEQEEGHKTVYKYQSRILCTGSYGVLGRKHSPALYAWQNKIWNLLGSILLWQEVRKPCWRLQ